MKKFSSCFPAALLSLAVFGASATHAAEWSAGFVPPAAPGESMRIDLPDDLDIMTLTTLGVELNGTDITAMLSLDGSDFVYTPVQPLRKGDNTVRLVDLGSGEEKGLWTFTVDGELSEAAALTGSPDAAQIARAESWLRGGSVDIDTYTEYSNRIADHNLTNAPDHSIASGAGDMRGEIEGERWDVRARGNYLLQTEPRLRLTGNTWDVGEYDVTASYRGDIAKGGVTVGHHDLGVNSLLMSNFYRRGASARLGAKDDEIAVTGFSFRPESASGARNITGLNDQDSRIDGGMLRAAPGGLEITGLYYDGSGGDGGLGVAGTSSVSEGFGWAAIVEKSLADERIKMRGEYAQSSYDEDGGAAAFASETGDAMSFLLEVRPLRESPVFLDKPADLNFGLSYQRIDTFFESLANQGLAADREAFRFFTNAYWGALSANLDLSSETNNVDDLRSLPTDRLRTAALNLAYSFNTQTGRLSWLGSPYLSFAGFVSDLERVKTPGGYDGPDTNAMSDSLSFGGGSSYEKWYWSASHTLSQYEDHANNASDTVNNFTTLGAGWMIDPRWNVNGGLSFGTFRDEDNSVATYDTNLNLGLDAVLIEDRLDLNFDYNLNLAGGSGDIPDRHIVNSEVAYTITPPSRNRPGMALAIRGSMGDTDGSSNGIQDETIYQVFTVLRVTAPFGFDF